MKSIDIFSSHLLYIFTYLVDEISRVISIELINIKNGLTSNEKAL